MGEPDTDSVRGPAVMVSFWAITLTDHVWLAGSSTAQDSQEVRSVALPTIGIGPPASVGAPGENVSVGADWDSTVPSSSWTEVCPPAKTSTARNPARVAARDHASRRPE